MQHIQAAITEILDSLIKDLKRTNKIDWCVCVWGGEGQNSTWAVWLFIHSWGKVSCLFFGCGRSFLYKKFNTGMFYLMTSTAQSSGWRMAYLGALI